MTSPKPKKDDVSFEAPTIGPKVYIAKGPSGWPETFKRDVANAALAKFVEPATIEEVVSLFVAKRELAATDDDEDKVITWFTITGFLGRTMNCTPLAVPHDVGIAFWANALIAFRTRTAN